MTALLLACTCISGVFIRWAVVNDKADTRKTTTTN